MRVQLQQDTNARGMQAQMYDDLRRRHDDLEREMVRRGTEQQMSNMYDNLQKKYDALANEMTRSRENAKNTLPIDDLRHRIEELSRDIRELKEKEYDRPVLPVATAVPPPPTPVVSAPVPPPSPAPPPSPTQAPDVFLMHFLCPFCGGASPHSHGNYFYPGYSGLAQESPAVTTGAPAPRRRRNTETQTPYIPHVTTTFVGHPTAPVAASTPYAPYYHNVIAAPVRHHTHTYPGVATTSPVVPAATMVTPGVPVVNSGGLIDTSAVHHIHHIPGGKSRTRRNREMSDSEESDSDEPVPRRHTRIRSNAGNRSSLGGYRGDELESYRLHQSLDVANRAARKMQQLSKRMLSNIATDLIRSGKR